MLPEHIPTVDRVNTYLRVRASENLCEDVLSCNTWAAEALLMEDLRGYIETSRPAPSASRADIRLYLRAVSWFHYPLPTPQELVHVIQTELDLAAQDKQLFASVFQEHLQDDAVEPAARRIDALYHKAWQALTEARTAAAIPWRDLEHDALPTAVIEAKMRVNALRPLRDTIYYYRHLPHWLSWHSATLHTRA